MIDQAKKQIVVVGNGMVGLRFCEEMVQQDNYNRFHISTFCEEPRAAYDRVGLTSFFAHRDAEQLMLAKMDWYREYDVGLFVGERVEKIDRERQVVVSDSGRTVHYDYLVMATGSVPFVPSIDGIQKNGVFVYRTIEDLEHIIEFAKSCRRAAVIGGGLLGLEAAKATHDLGLETHVLEFAPRLMPRQLDTTGSKILVRKIEDLGVQIHLSKSASKVLGTDTVRGIEFTDGSSLDTDMIVVSAGILPRDELAKTANIEMGERGGIIVDDQLRTSDENIFAIGEVAIHDGMQYGLVAPGYEMAAVLASNLCGREESFLGADVSTKLKLMGVDVATFGDVEETENAVPAILEDPIQGVYKKLLIDTVSNRLLGGILVGDCTDYGLFNSLVQSHSELKTNAYELLSSTNTSSNPTELTNETQVCSCNRVSKQEILDAIENQDCSTIGQIKSCTKAGAGCGGCIPLVTDILHRKLEESGQSISRHLCEHFALSRTELFAIIKTKKLKTFGQVIDDCGIGFGCETCKPTVASILASLWNENVLEEEHQTNQDTNDRFLANMQRGGLFSVVPRVPGGEITPDKLMVIAQIAKDYGLYTKITGGQRIDLFGATSDQLPEIWQRLVEAGMESGHAYGKALRTVKSCVGTTWCRFGVQDSVSFAIHVENRYKGIRAPHKVKMAVSGCVRECAEAQSKDVGLVATENGYNLYVCGNGGAKPKHAELLVADIDEETAIRFIDRFFMYYISTADKLTRTSVWSEQLEGGIDHIREVVVDDKLGICDELETMMQALVDTYECEWKRVVNDPEQRRRFKQFANSAETEPVIEFVSQRGQKRPSDWLPDETPIDVTQIGDKSSSNKANLHQASQKEWTWVEVGFVDDFPTDGGATIKYGQSQIAVFHFASQGKWYASQQMCPHKKAFVLSKGILGDADGIAKIACPLHKKTFSLETGSCTNDDEYSIDVFAVETRNGKVFVHLPPTEVMNRIHATEIGRSQATTCASRCSSTATETSSELARAETH